MSNESRQYPNRSTRPLVGLAISCVVVALVDLLYEKHPHVKFEALFNFYGFFAVAATVVVLLLAICFKSLVERKEDYYDG